MAGCLLALLAPPSLVAQIGVLGGFNREDLGDFTGAGDFTLSDSVEGFHVGIFLDFGMGRLGLRPGITYRRLPGAVLTGADRIPVDIEIVEFPLDARIAARLPVARPYVLVGAAAMFPASARSPIDDRLVGSRIRFDFGAGLEWDMGFRISPEIRYGRGTDGLLRNDVERAGIGNAKFDSFSFRVAVSF